MADRVLMLSPYFPPELVAGIFRSLRFVKYLPLSGWQPIVLTVRPSVYDRHPLDEALAEQVPADTVVVRATVLRPAERLRSMFAGQPTASREIGQPVGRVVDGPPRPAQKVKNRGRRINEVVKLVMETPDPMIGWLIPAVAKAWRLVRQYEPRLVYSTSPPHSSHVIALLISRITGLPLVLDFRDPWARSPWKQQNAWQERLNRSLERICVQGADRVILNTRRVGEEFQSYYSGEPPGKFSVLPNGYDPELLTVVDSLLRESSGGRADAAIHICHPGTAYGRRDLLPLLAAVARLRDSGRAVTFEQVGYVSHDNRNGLGSFLDEHSLREHVNFTGQLPHRETLRRAAAADLLLVLQPGTSNQVPGKLYEMLTIRKPVVALTHEGETADMVRRYHLGVVAQPEDVDAIGEAIIRAAAMKPSGQVEAALRLFDGRRLTGELAALFDGVVSPG